MPKFVEFKKAPYKGLPTDEPKDREKVLINLESVVAIDGLSDGSSGPECNISLLNGKCRAVLGTLEEIKICFDLLGMTASVGPEKM